MTIDLHIGRPVYHTQLVPGPDWADCPHTVLRVVAAQTAHVWIIDAAGCQYGFRDVLVPLDRYLATHAARPTAAPPKPYDATETTDLDYFDTLPFLNITRAQRDDRAIDRRDRRRFAAFVDTHVHADQLLGKASAEAFAQRLDHFARALREHMAGLADPT